MRPLRLLVAWLLGAAVYLVAGMALLLGAVLVAVATSSSFLDPEPGATTFGGAMVAVVTMVVLTPVVAGALSALAACGIYRWHTGMPWWKWTVVTLGGPALLWLALTSIAQATTGIGAQLRTNVTSDTSPMLGMLLVGLAVGTPALSGIAVGRVKNRRAAALQEALWPGAARDVAGTLATRPVSSMTGAIPRVTRGGRDTVAIVGGAAVGVLLVATGTVTTV